MGLAVDITYIGRGLPGFLRDAHLPITIYGKTSCESYSQKHYKFNKAKTRRLKDTQEGEQA